MSSNYKKLTDKIKNTFQRDTIQLNSTLQRIEIYWMCDPRGKIWCPYSGGPLYGQSAIDEAHWIKKHLEEFRSLLPTLIREWNIVVGELDCRTFPGVFSQK